MSETPLLSPSPPTPRRLNSFALILLSLAGALLLATVVYFVSQRPAPPPRTTSPVPRPESESAEPAFLRRPPSSYPHAAGSAGSAGSGVGETGEPGAIPRSGADPAELAALEALSRGTPLPGPSGAVDPTTGRPVPGGTDGIGGGAYAGTAYPQSPYRGSVGYPAGLPATSATSATSATPATSPPTPADPRREAYQRALHAPISISAPPSPRESTGGALPGFPGLPGFSGLPGLAGASALSSLPALRIPGLTEPLPEPASPAPAPQDPTTAFLSSAATSREPRLAVTVDPPLGAFEASGAEQLDAGSLIPAVLATGINSDLPGDLVAQVSRDVFDSRSQRRVLIPKGSRLLGRYQNQIAAGQKRLLVAWDRLLFPDGRSLRFPGLPGTSLSGEAGLPGSVDNHLPTVFGSALLLSLLSAGVQLSQPQQSATFGQAASAGQVGAAALGQELSTVSTELLRRRLAIAPTLRIPSGTEFNVFVRGDLALTPYR
jgi:hypothetical protein